jgi:hypothetical protein
MVTHVLQNLKGIMNGIKWKSFAVGLVCGLALACVGFYLLGQRYRIEHFGPENTRLIRLDTWTGRSWTSRAAPGQMFWTSVQEP